MKFQMKIPAATTLSSHSSKFMFIYFFSPLYGKNVYQNISLEDLDTLDDEEEEEEEEFENSFDEPFLTINN